MTRREALRSLMLLLATPLVAGCTLAATTATGAKPKLRVLQDKCVACDKCVRIAPNTFQIDRNTGKAKVVNPRGDPPAKINQAIAACPTEAIVRD